MQRHLSGRVLVTASLTTLVIALGISLGGCGYGDTAGDTAGEDASESPSETTTETPSETTTDSSEGSALYSDLAVCPTDEAGDAGCPLDQSDAPLETSDVTCSTLYSGDSDVVSIRIDHEGAEVFTKDITGVLDGGADSVPVTGFLGTGTLTIPGGSYTCTFDDGAEQASIEFESAGEPGPAAYTWACDEAETTTEDNATFCTEDTDTLSGVDALTCSTLLTGVLDQPIEAQLAVTDSSIDSEASFELTGAAPLGILVAHVTLDGEKLAGSPGAQVPAGSYRCEWVVGGEPVDVKVVEVTG